MIYSVGGGACGNGWNPVGIHPFSDSGGPLVFGVASISKSGQRQYALEPPACIFRAVLQLERTTYAGNLVHFDLISVFYRPRRAADLAGHPRRGPQDAEGLLSGRAFADFPGDRRLLAADQPVYRADGRPERRRVQRRAVGHGVGGRRSGGAGRHGALLPAPFPEERHYDGAAAA